MKRRANKLEKALKLLKIHENHRADGDNAEVTRSHVTGSQVIRDSDSAPNHGRSIFGAGSPLRFEGEIKNIEKNRELC